MKNYVWFCKSFIAFSEAKKLGCTESFGNDPEAFINNIRYSITNCKIFSIEDDIKKLLLMTKPPNENSMFQLPFPETFIDVSFTREEINQLGLDMGYGKIIGIMLREGDMIYDDKENNIKKPVGRALTITIYSETGEKLWFDTFNKNWTIEKEYQDWKVSIQEQETTDAQARDIVYMFALNFLNFINNPEIETIEVTWSKERNEKRIKKGKVPIPTVHHIRVTGVLKEYVNQLGTSGSFNYSHRFWVRGHFRTLKSEARYGDNAGKRVWILPYIKGKGILIRKQYDIIKNGGNKHGINSE